MSKPIATAIIDERAFSGFGGERETPITAHSAQGARKYHFYAPGWRPMTFRSPDAAKAKMERHPGFVRWAA